MIWWTMLYDLSVKHGMYICMPGYNLSMRLIPRNHFFQDGSSYFWQVRSDHFLHTKFGWGHEPLAPFHVHVFA